jgi:hypothetical protein
VRADVKATTNNDDKSREIKIFILRFWWNNWVSKS